MELQNEIGGSVWPTQARMSTLSSLKRERGAGVLCQYLVQQHFKRTLLCFVDADICSDTLRDTDPFVTVTIKLLKNLHTSFRTSSEPRAQNRWPALPLVMP